MERAQRIERVKKLAGRTRAAVIFLWALGAIALLGRMGSLGGRFPSEGEFRLGSVILRAEDWCGGPCSSLGDYGAVFALLAALHLGAYLALWVWGTWSFERLLRLYQLGRVFGRETALRLRHFGTALMLWASLDLFGWVLWSAAAHSYRLATDIAAFSALLVGFVFWLMAYVNREAAELAQEVELTI